MGYDTPRHAALSNGIPLPETEYTASFSNFNKKSLSRAAIRTQKKRNAFQHPVFIKSRSYALINNFCFRQLHFLSGSGQNSSLLSFGSINNFQSLFRSNIRHLAAAQILIFGNSLVCNKRLALISSLQLAAPTFAAIAQNFICNITFICACSFYILCCQN